MPSFLVTQVPWFEILLRTGLIYLIVLAGLRLTGKRQIGQLSPFDLVLLLLLSNAVQNAMTGPDTSLTGGILAAGTLLILNQTFSFLVSKNRRLGKMVEGSPTLLIHNGKIMEAHLQKENISHDELMQAIREHGINSVKDVELAILEVDGSISVLKDDDLTEAARARHRLKYLNRQSK